MALSNQDRVLEKSTTTGTGTYTLAGSPGITGFSANDYDTFASVGNGNTCVYVAVGVDPATGIPNNTGWEVGLGTYTASGTTLARTTIYSSSNSDSAVSWGAGTRFIFVSPSTSNIGVASFTANQSSSGGTGTVFVGPIPGASDYGGIWFGQSSPSAANYSFLGKAGESTFFNNATSCEFRIGNVTHMFIRNANLAVGYGVDIGTGATLTTMTAIAPLATYRAIVCRGYAGQSANLQEWRDSSDTVLSFVGPTGWIQNTPGEARLTSDFTKSNATLGNTALSINVIAGRSYRIEGYLIISNTTAGDGFKCDFDGGSCTATDFDVCLHAAPDSAASVALGTTAVTTLAGDMNYTTVTGTNRVFVRGSIKVNAGGTLIFRASEDATSTGTLTLGKGSWLALYDTVNL